MAAGVVADDAVDAHGRDGLDDHDADDDEVPEAEDAAEFRLGDCSGFGAAARFMP